jgi:cytochrome c-type biogenesis protein CcsB
MVWSSFQVFQSNSTFGGLVVLTSVYWYNLIDPKITQLKQVAFLGTLAVNLLLFLTLAGRWIFSGYFPLSNLYESLLFLTWILLTIQILAESKTQSKIIGSVIAPVCLLIVAFTTLILPTDMQRATPLVPALQSNWLMMHVSMMMVSYATLILGSLFCVLFLLLISNNEINLFRLQTVLNRKIGSICFVRYRSKIVFDFALNSYRSFLFSLSTIYFLPFLRLKQSQKLLNSSSTYFFYNWCNSLALFISRFKLLNNIDIWSYRTIGIGFPFLTIGIISGAVWANESWGSYWSWDPKETWALITWLVFASYLHSRITKKVGRC